ncbi:hypothetical protein GM3708_1316 [Geminocystis sp. NIES-3708]|uniref:hypothetical protein n=1 Tax=Geminocystis sp. NIES-3708 TaxID=1615909 RepID=UPI0005FCC4DF|nr:hypothetical protein [Geminocystis sp. NIES-3708]BAQ60910.1 hypothetical protein GM3708_1316 [Geminocystis sp. NIES-3708]
MKQKTYSINPAKIGNQQGFRLPSAFYKENPQFAEATGEIEVLNDDTLLLRINPKNDIDEEEEETLMMSIFLDFLTKDALKNPEQLKPYTQEMSDEIDNLLTGVDIEE